MVAEKAGGYPSKYNPIATFAFIKNLFKLEKEYSKVMPQPEFMYSAGGLEAIETSADCYAQSSIASSQSYTGAYVGKQGCTNAQKTLADQLSNTLNFFNADEAIKEILERDKKSPHNFR